MSATQEKSDNPGKAKLYTVSGPLDNPVKGEAIDIQFNPNSLKVTLANSLKENERSGNTRAAQYIDKSSSTLTVELIFDTTLDYITKDSDGNTIPEIRKDVRDYTRAIAFAFMHSEDVGDDSVEPERCYFAWGTFAFVGIMESLDETLEFFSPEGTPLRATVAIKLTESRFQFRSEEARAAQRDTPTLGSSDGNDNKEWREVAMYNGEESPRTPASSSQAIPSASAIASLKASASLGGGISGGFSAGLGAGAGFGFGGGLSVGVSGGLSAGMSAGVSGGIDIGAGAGLTAGVSGGLGGGLSASVDLTPPAFSFGSSASLGTGIPGAFSADIQTGGGISAGSIVSGGVQLHSGSGLQSSSSGVSGAAGASSSASVSSNVSGSAQASSSVGFD